MATSPESQVNDPIFDKFPEGQSSGETNTTPNSELSPPDSPKNNNVGLSKGADPRTNARNLAASLSLEEQVRFQPSSN